MVGTSSARDDYRRGRAIFEERLATIRRRTDLDRLWAGRTARRRPGRGGGELRKDYEALDAMGERNYISSIGAAGGSALPARPADEARRAPSSASRSRRHPTFLAISVARRQGQAVVAGRRLRRGHRARDLRRAPDAHVRRHREPGAPPWCSLLRRRPQPVAPMTPPLRARGTRPIRGQGEHRVSGPGGRVRLAPRRPQRQGPGDGVRR